MKLINGKKKDPIKFSKNYLISKKIMSEKKIENLNKNLLKKIHNDFQYIAKLKRPQFKNIKNLVYKI